MRIVLIGTVESTAVTLECMHQAGHPPVAVIGLDTSLAHRHSDFIDMEPLARAVGAEFVPVSSVNSPEVLERIAVLEPDWLVVVGWSQILNEPLLGVARLGSIGYHPSPLPEMRGRAVLAWTILLNRTWTAGTLFTLKSDVDSGDILAQHKFELDPRENLATLMAKHMDGLRVMWADLLNRLSQGAASGIAQDAARITHCAKRTAADGLIDWTRDVESIDRLVRAVTAPYPGAFSTRAGERLVIWEAEPWSGPIHYGAPGQVLSVAGTEFLIACRLGETLRIRRWEWAGLGEHRPLRISDRLGDQ